MALIYPKNPSMITQGEKTFYKNIISSLNNEWYVFYEPLIYGTKPDFVIFHPNYGITIVEIKDYNKNSLTKLTPKTWEISIDKSLKTVKSPIEQVIGYRNHLINKFSNEQELISTEEPYIGRPKLPISVMCCFPYISKRDHIYKSISQMFTQDTLIVKEEISVEDFYTKFINSFKQLFSPKKLTNKEINNIIHVLYPSFNLEYNSSNKKQQEYKDLLENASLFRFDNYVDELFFVVDTIAHMYNVEKIQLNNFVIIVNSKRSLLPISKEYVQTLIELLINKNFNYSTEKEIKEGIFICTYETFKHTEISVNNKIFLIDFNKISFDLIKEHIASYKDLSNKNIIITSNQHINI